MAEFGVTVRINETITEGIKRIVSSIENFSDKSEKSFREIEQATKRVSRSLDTLNVKGRTFGRQFSRSVTDASTSVGRFRDDLLSSNVGLNRLINTSAVFIRRLARIRTAFFILVTFLALRPITNFFKGLGEFSAIAERSLDRVGRRFDDLRRRIGDSVAPILEIFGSALVSRLKNIFEFITSKEFEEFFNEVLIISDRFVRTLIIIGKIAKELFNIGLIGFRTIMTGFNALIGSMSFVFGEFVSFVAHELTRIDVNFNILEKLGFTEGRIEDVRDSLVKLFDFGREIRRFGSELTAQAKETFTDFILSGKATQELDTSVDEISRLFNEELPRVILESKFAVALKTAFGEFARRAREAASSTVDNVESVFAAFLQGFDLLREKFLDFVKDFGRALKDTIEEAISDTLLAVVEGRLRDLRDVLTSFLDAVKKDIISFVASTLRQQFIHQGLAPVLTQIGNLFTGVGTTSAAGTGTASQLGRIATGPTVTKVGEEGAEAIVRLGPRGGVPVEFTNRRGMGEGATVIFAPQLIDNRGSEQFLLQNEKVLTRIISSALRGRSSDLRGAVRSI